MFKSIIINSLLALTLTACTNANSAMQISHRGYDENKISGFIEAVFDGFDYLETDVRLRNGEIVLLHDDVACSDCDKLSTLLSFARHYNVTVFIEVKEYEAIEKTVEIVNRYDDVILISFDTKTLIKLNSMTNYPLGLVTSDAKNVDEVSSIIDWVFISKNYVDNCVSYLKCAAWTISNDADLDLVNSKFGFAGPLVDAFVMDRW